MQGLSYCTLTGKEFLHHAFYLLSETCFVEVETKYILTGIEILETRIILICLAYLQRSHDSLEFCQQWVGRWLEWLQVVIQCLEVTCITCQYQWNQHEIAFVETAVDILLDGLTEADREFLTGISSDTLRSIWHEWVRQTLVDNGADKLVWVQYTWICYYWHCLDITDLLDE